jgi:proteasome lid subunit RPN8/RPN11
MEPGLSSVLIEQLLAAARAAHPLEACGLLLGRQGEIEEIRACANVHPDPARQFEIDPRALIDAHRTARAGGLEVVGYYHSHPSGPPEPSPTDRGNGTGDGKVWAIVGEGVVTLWRDTEDGFVPLSYTCAGR